MKPYGALLVQYVDALEAQDEVVLSRIRQLAQNDASLERLLSIVHTSYQEDEREEYLQHKQDLEVFFATRI